MILRPGQAFGGGQVKHMFCVENDHSLQYTLLSPAELIAGCSLISKYYLLALTMVPIDQYQYYVGRGAANRFQHKPPIRTTRCITKTLLPCHQRLDTNGISADIAEAEGAHWLAGTIVSGRRVLPADGLGGLA